MGGHHGIRPVTNKPVSLFMRILLTALMVAFFPGGTIQAQPSMTSDAQVIHSDVLDYDLQYWVYTPAGYDELEGLDVLYLSDGAWYKDVGGMPAVLDSLISSGLMEPILAVFLDPRIPGYEHLSRRNAQFFCNQSFMDFYRQEFIPTIDAAYRTRADRSARTMAGLSFGGLNAACFGLHANDAFEGIAMQSPATHPVRYIHQAYADSARLPLRIFLSSGDHQDNEARTRAFRDILIEKEYPLKYIEVPFAHNWENWGPLLDDLLLFFYGRESEE